MLRPYQERCVAELRAQYQAGRNKPVCVMPTGAGKAVVAAHVIRMSLAKKLRALLLVPRIELLNQGVRKIREQGIEDIRVIQADRDEGNPGASVVAASIPTLATKKWLENLPPADIVLVDECHHGKARTHEELLSRYSQSKLLGFSATPERGDGRGIGDIFDSIVIGATVKELTEQGYLVPCSVYAPPRIMDSRELALDPVEAYARYTPGEKTLVFCSTVEQARVTCETFSASGIRARWLSGESLDRDEIVLSFARRDFDVLVNVNVCVEGFDDPPIESAIFAKRFTHVGSYLQAIGRTLRSSPGKRIAKIVDLCGSALVHGTPDLEREYSLTGKGISSKREPIRQCQQCGGVFVSSSASECIYCSFKLPALTRAQRKALGLELEEVDSTRKATSWPMRAKRRGICAGCSKLIVPNIWIVYSSKEKKAMHASCAGRIERAEKSAEKSQKGAA